MNDMQKIWVEHYDNLITEDAKIHFLKSLKKISQEGNKDAYVVVKSLVTTWVDEKYHE